MHQGRLQYRLPGAGKRVSYRTLNDGLIKKRMVIYMTVQILPFRNYSGAVYNPAKYCCRM
jgi:hypothetical protein